MCYLTEGASIYLQHLDNLPNYEEEHYCFVDGALYKENEMIFVTYKGDWVYVDNINEYLELITENETKRNLDIITTEVQKLLLIQKR